MKPTKCLLSTDANDRLEKMLTASNENFSDGKISKQALLSWIVLDFAGKRFEKSLPQIRKEHVDPIRALKSYISDLESAKRVGRQAAIPASVQAILKAQTND